jgi:ferric enterobactin receptor
MRPITIIAFCLFIQLPGNLYSQKKDVIIREYFESRALTLVLSNLSIAYNLSFLYDPADLEGIRINSINIKGLDLESTMIALLKDTGLDFSIENGREVHIFPKVDKPVEMISPTRSNIAISGRIYDQKSGESLPYSTVALAGTTTGVISNIDGHFALLNVPSDTSTIMIQFLGYETQTIKLNPDLANKEIEVYLKPVDYRIEEIMVVGEEKKLVTYAEKTSQISLRPAQIEMIPSLGEKDIFRTLQLMPGVSSGNETSSGLYVRGGTPDQNLILLDGFTVYHVDHFYGFLSAFNADAIKDVQLYKGGFESKYGGKISSVMELTGKTGNTKKTSGGISVSALSGNAYLEVPLSQKLNFFLSARRSYTDFIKSGLYNKINDMYNSANKSQSQPGGRFARFVTEPKFHFYDLNAKITIKPGRDNIITFSFYNGKDVLDKTNDVSTPFGGGGPPPGGMQSGSFPNFALNSIDMLKWGNWGTSGKWSRQWNEKFYSNSILAFSNYFSWRDNYREREVTDEDGTATTTRTGTQEDNNILDYTFRTDHEYRLTNKNTLEFGLQSTYNDVRYYYSMNDTLDLTDTRTEGVTLAGYFQDKIFLKDKLTFLCGLRTTWYNQTRKVYAEPRISANYQLNDHWKLKASWGKYYQFTSQVIRENVLEGNRDFWLLADDKTIPVSSAYHYIAGASFEDQSFLIDLELFYKPMKGLSEYIIRENLGPRSASSIPDHFFSGSGTAKGIELLLQKKYGHYTGWISYTYSRVIHTFGELNDGNPYPAINDQPHELNVVNTYQINNWVLGATFVYNSGRTYTAPVGAYQLTMLDGSIMDYTHVSAKNAYRLPAYHRLDVSVTYRFSIGRNLMGSVGLSLFNVYGRKNIWYREFDIQDNNIIIMDVNTLGFTPNLFVSLKF